MAFLSPLPLTQAHYHKRSKPNHVTRVTSTIAGELSTSLPETSLPKPIQRTTIYHILPHRLPYLPPPTHPSDNDTLLLALSLQTPWLRTRYIRTRPFIRESRLRKRLYRGTHGTPLQSGSATKPKSLPTASFATAKWLIAYGRNLPYKLSPRDLVTFGETALGDVLTDAELVDQRGTEVAHQAVYKGASWVLTVARNPAGRVLRTFVVVTEVGKETRRVATVNAFEGRQIAVCDDYIVVVGWNVASIGGVSGLMKGLFGGREGPPRIDVTKGSQVLVIDKSGRIAGKGIVDGVLSNISVRQSDHGGVSITARQVVGDEVTLTTLEDVRSGDAFINDRGIRTYVIGYDTSSSGEFGEVRRLGSKNVKPMDMAKVYDADNGQSTVYIGYNSVSQRIGLWDLDGTCWEAAEGDRISGAIYDPSHKYISVLATNSDRPPKILFIDTADIAGGPVAEVVLDGLGAINTSVDAIWTDWDFEYSQENAKIVKSAYELFAEKEWNDIDSGFSSLGLRL